MTPTRDFLLQNFAVISIDFRPTMLRLPRHLATRLFLGFFWRASLRYVNYLCVLLPGVYSFKARVGVFALTSAHAIVSFSWLESIHSFVMESFNAQASGSNLLNT